MPTLSLTVNGVPHTLDVPGNRFLAEVLRYDLGLTGTKIGCNEAECGACTVIVNGRSVDSCIYPAFKAQNADVLTIEGVAGEWQRCAGCNKEHCDEQAHARQAGAQQAGVQQAGSSKQRPRSARHSRWKTRSPCSTRCSRRLSCMVRRSAATARRALSCRSRRCSTSTPTRPTKRSSTVSRTPTAAAPAMPRS